MAYSVEFTPVADKDLDNLSHITIKRILKRIQIVCEDPRAYAKPLKSSVHSHLFVTRRGLSCPV